MKILIVGRGWVGKKLFNEFVKRNHDVEITSHDLAIETVSNNSDFDWVVNCTGVTGTPNVDACELDKPGTIEANAVYPILLYEAVRKTKSRFAHFSSGCIYEGTIEDVHAEPNYFGSIYSVSKGISDSYLLNKAVVYRIRMPFTSSNESKNFLTKIIKYAKTAKLVEGGSNSLTDLDEAIVVAANVIERDEPNGGYNLVNKGSVTMHELVDLMGIETQWFSPEEFATVTKAKRSNCVIPSYPEMSDVKTALYNAIQQLKTQTV